MSTPTEFNIRIYGIFIENNHLLVSDELIQKQSFTKLPGGGLEFGESPIEALIRESKEEMDCEIEVVDHFYTTQDYVQSAFRPWQQVVCIYFTARIITPHKLITSKKRHDFDYTNPVDQESFRWVPLDEVFNETFSFLSDKQAIKVLCDKYALLK